MPGGIAILDFGAFPGKSDASVPVVWQNWITSNSRVQAWFLPMATPEHSADEHLIETLKVLAGNIVPGVGFTIYGFNTSERLEPVSVDGRGGGKGTRIYGRWTVAWTWQ